MKFTGGPQHRRSDAPPRWAFCFFSSPSGLAEAAWKPPQETAELHAPKRFNHTLISVPPFLLWTTGLHREVQPRYRVSVTPDWLLTRGFFLKIYRSVPLRAPKE